jgi:hypothetical protein
MIFKQELVMAFAHKTYMLNIEINGNVLEIN